MVATAESSAQEVDADTVDIIEAYNVALGRYVRLVRDTLPLYSGYECKEPEPGKFTIAFPWDFPLYPLLICDMQMKIMTLRHLPCLATKTSCGTTAW